MSANVVIKKGPARDIWQALFVGVAFDNNVPL
jgi:hypothetical protein